MRKRSTVLIHIFSEIHSKQRFRLNMYMYIRSLLSKTCSNGIVFAKFNQIYPCTFKNLTIFNAFSYLRHVKRLGICLPRGRSHSIINIPEIVTSRWRIERCHGRRTSGVRVKRDAGHTSLSKALFTPITRSRQSLIGKRRFGAILVYTLIARWRWYATTLFNIDVVELPHSCKIE